MHILSLFLIAFFLTLWFQFKADKLSGLFSLLTAGSLVFYLYFLISSSYALSTFASFLFLDGLLISAIGLINILIRNKMVLKLILIASAFFAYFSISSIDNKTSDFQSKEKQAEVDVLDDRFEYLLGYKKDKVDQVRETLEELKSPFNFHFEEIFDPKNEGPIDHYMGINFLDNPETIQSEFEAEILSRSDIFHWVEPNEVIRLDPVHSKRKTKSKTNKFYNDPKVEEQWAISYLDIQALHELIQKKKLKPKKRVILAILDTGVDSKHEDLKGNFVSIDKRSDSDSQGHGTHCAGIAGAVSQNKIGVASTNPAKAFYAVTSVKVLNDLGIGSQKGIIDGIIKAVDQGADVISLSLGSRSSKLKQKAYAEAVAYANKKGVIVLVAAGNSSKNAKFYSPANTPGVIAVSALDEEGKLASFSNHVRDLDMGISAPGANILSTFPENKYQAFNGTSMACPAAAGTVALLKSIRPELTTEQAFKLLRESNPGIQSKTTASLQPKSALELLLQEDF